jgi:hypothetical protein
LYGLKHTSPFVLNNKITAFCHLIFKTLSPLSVSGAENAFALASNACHAQMGSNAKTHFLKNNLLFMLKNRSKPPFDSTRHIKNICSSITNTIPEIGSHVRRELFVRSEKKDLEKEKWN